MTDDPSFQVRRQTSGSEASKLAVRTPSRHDMEFVFSEDAARCLLAVFMRRSGSIGAEHPRISEITFALAEDDLIDMNGSSLRLNLSDETFEQGVWLIDGYLRKGWFDIAEFCEVEWAKPKPSTGRPRMTRLYFLGSVADVESP